MPNQFGLDVDCGCIPTVAGQIRQVAERKLYNIIILILYFYIEYIPTFCIDFSLSIDINSVFLLTVGDNNIINQNYRTADETYFKCRWYR